jgi:hypothetical protein
MRPRMRRLNTLIASGNWNFVQMPSKAGELIILEMENKAAGQHGDVMQVEAGGEGEFSVTRD